MRARHAEHADPPRRGGRPKGSQNAKTILQRIALERHTVTEAGQQRRLTKVDLLLQVLSRKVMTGELAAAKLLADFAARHQPVRDGGGYLIIPGYPGTREEWLADVKAYQDKLWRGSD